MKKIKSPEKKRKDARRGYSNKRGFSTVRAAVTAVCVVAVIVAACVIAGFNWEEDAPVNTETTETTETTGTGGFVSAESAGAAGDSGIGGVPDRPGVETGGAAHTPTAQQTPPAAETPWYLILVNRWNYIPEDYLIPKVFELSNGQKVDARIYPDLQEMFDTARSENIYPTVVSSLRTGEEQQQMLDDKIAELKSDGYDGLQAETEAMAQVSVPGTSEHQLGLAVDINAGENTTTHEEVYKWLEENSYKFGFIRRYPADKTQTTGVIYEPWHYRYVGREAADEIYESDICLEEYLNRELTPDTD